MKLLSRDAFDNAKYFIKTNARRLDQLMFTYEFENTPKETVVNELQNYQSTENGFGLALEPDIRMKDSSVIATTVALQYLTNLRVNDQHPMVKDCINFLVSQSRSSEDMIYFPKVGIEVMKSPRAPWWNTESIIPPKLDRWPNPNAEVIGYLNRWSKFLDNKGEDLLEQCNLTMERYLGHYEEIVEFEMYQYLCWKRALPHLPNDIKKRVEEMILRQVDEKTLKPDNLDHASPHWLVTEKTSLLYLHYRDTIESLLRKEIEQQAPDGGWYPTWKWRDELWEQVESEWAGKLTVDLLLTLKYLDQIEDL